MFIFILLLIFIAPLAFTTLFSKKNILTTFIFVMFGTFAILITARGFSATYNLYSYMFYGVVTLSITGTISMSIFINKKETFAIWKKNINEGWKTLVIIYIALCFSLLVGSLLSHLGSDIIAYSRSSSNFKFYDEFDDNEIYALPTFYYSVSVIGEFQLSYTLLTSVLQTLLWTVAFQKIFYEFVSEKKKFTPVLFVLVNVIAILAMRLAVGSSNITLIAIVVIVGFAIRKQGMLPILLLPLALVNFSSTGVVISLFIFVAIILSKRSYSLKDLMNIGFAAILLCDVQLVIFMKVTHKIYLLILPIAIIWMSLNILEIKKLEASKTFKKFSDKLLIIIFVASIVFYPVATGISLGLSHILETNEVWYGKMTRIWVAFAASILLTVILIICKSKISRSIMIIVSGGLISYGLFALAVPVFNLAGFIPNRTTDELWVSVVILIFIYSSVKVFENGKNARNILLVCISTAFISTIVCINIGFEGSNLNSKYGNNFRWIEKKDLKFIKDNSTEFENKKIYGDLPWLAFAETKFYNENEANNKKLIPPHGLYRNSIGDYEKREPKETESWGIVKLDKDKKLLSFIQQYDYLIIKSDEYKKIIDKYKSNKLKIWKMKNGISIYKIIH